MQGHCNLDKVKSFWKSVYNCFIFQVQKDSSFKIMLVSIKMNKKVEVG